MMSASMVTSQALPRGSVGSPRLPVPRCHQVAYVRTPCCRRGKLLTGCREGRPCRPPVPGHASPGAPEPDCAVRPTPWCTDVEKATSLHSAKSGSVVSSGPGGLLAPRRGPAKGEQQRDARDLGGRGRVYPAKVHRLWERFRQQHRAAGQVLVPVLWGAALLGVLVHSGSEEVPRRRARRERARHGVPGAGGGADREATATQSAISRAPSRAHCRSRNGSGGLPSRSPLEARAGLVEAQVVSPVRHPGARCTQDRGQVAPATVRVIGISFRRVRAPPFRPDCSTRSGRRSRYGGPRHSSAPSRPPARR